MIITLIILFGLSALVYLARTLFFLNGARKERGKVLRILDDQELPFISIVVPARNEESNIENCLLSLSQNDYPIEKFEIIVVNDRSTDSTGEVLKEMQMKFSNLKILTLTDDNKDKNLKGKPGALQYGIDHSSGEIVLMTDADCTVSRKWMRTMTSAYFNGDNIALVSSFTHIKGRRIFKIMQAVEWCYMHTMAHAGVGMNNPLGCFGNNLSIKKKVFDEIGGYKNIRFSVTEDLALQKAVFKNHHQIRYLVNKESLVTTLPSKNLKEYLSQRHRWAKGGIDLGWDGAFFVLSSVAVWVGILISLILTNYYMLIGMVAFRVFCDYTIIIPSLHELKKRWLVTWVIPSVIFFMIIEIVVPFLLLKKNIVWKDQIFIYEKTK